MDETVPALFERTVRSYGDRVALRRKKLGLWQDISWNSYYRDVRSVGSALVELGLEPGQCVSLIGNNCTEWVVADLGVQCVGGISVGIYATNAAEQVAYVANHSESVFFFVENEEQLDKWLSERDNYTHLKKVIVWDTEGLRDFSDPMVISFKELLQLGIEVCRDRPDLFSHRSAAVGSQDVCALIYTSGTTGPPKGAMLTHRNVVALVEALIKVNPMAGKDEVLSFLPLCHIFERIFTVFAHIKMGYTVNFVESPDTIADNMGEVSPTVGYGVPRIWEKYAANIHIRMSEASWFKRVLYRAACKIGTERAALRMGFEQVPFLLECGYRLSYFIVFKKLKERLGFERMRIAYSGAAPISQEVLLFFQAIGINVVEGYGQTEGTGITCVSQTDSVKFGAVGQPLPETEVRIADDGEILVKSPSVFKGYYRNPEETAKTLRDGWLHSGDIGELDGEGFLKITDRKKDIIVTAAGKNISPQYIENKLKASLYINDAVVIGDKRKFITCLILIDEDTVVQYAQDNKIQFSTYRDLTESEEIRLLIRRELEKVNKTLSKVEQPKKFRIVPKKLYVEDGEVTPTMKVKRKFVHESFCHLIEDMYAPESRTV